ncbi:MAG: SDR family oxidoreductase [Deltaproteobacteria bacterium]|nr:SDR family oxidoreductase [Deltaproteobacteria bacterium]
MSSTVLITGANRGIGLEITRQLVARGDRVIATCRTPSRELAASGATVEANVDVSDSASVEALARRLEGRPLDWLVNNAGQLSVDSLDQLDEPAIRRQFEVNALGPLRVTAALAPLLRDGGKVALVTSRMGSMGDNTSGRRYGYRMSKAALNAAGVSLAHDLAPRGIAVAILHPGYVRTEMTGGNGDLEPADAARNLIARIDELTPASSGRFLHSNGSALPW